MLKILIDLPLVSSRSLVLTSLYKFASGNRDRKKIQTIGFASSNIEDIKTLSYKPKKTIKYENGKYCFYRARPSYWRVFRAYSLYVAAVLYLLYVLYTKKYVDSYPITKHMYVGGIAIIAFLITRKFLHHQNIVKEINLLEGGKATEIVFQNRMKRKLFGQITSKTLYNSLFVSPKQSQQHLGMLNAFPKDLRADTGAQMSSYWKKYYSNYSNYLLIPVEAELIDKEVLSEVMNGKIIIS